MEPPLDFVSRYIITPGYALHLTNYIDMSPSSCVLSARRLSKYIISSRSVGTF
jgi:hypothetical protein